MTVPPNGVLEVSAAKRKKLEALLAAQGVQNATAAIPRRTESAPAPLSFAQERLWFLDELEPGGTAYNVPTALRLGGALDVDALARTLGEIVRRHHVLRSTFRLDDGVPVQEARVAELPLTVHDLSDMDDVDARRAEARRRADAEMRTPFSLSAGPLMRATLLKLDDDEHVLLLCMHHVVSDGWSRGVLYRELGALYAAFAAGQPSPLPELPIQYADYAAWQRQHVSGDVLQRQLAFWRERLAGIPTALELPADRPRPALQTVRGGNARLELSPGLTAQVKALSRVENATPFMTLLAAFKVLLSRWSGQTDIVVGSPIAGRTRPELEGLMGLFMNTLALRTDLDGDPVFRTLLGRVREATLSAYQHQDLPFERLVEELKTERDLSRSPVFQVLFSLQNAPRDGLKLGGLELSPVEFDAVTAKFDLSLYAWEQNESLVCTFNYNADLFDAATVERMAGHFRVLLEAITTDADRRVSALPLLQPAERGQVILDWNATRADYRRDDTLHAAIERQAAATPHAQAVAADRVLTYAELNAEANRLARRLRALGVTADVPVGVYMDRTADTVVAMLGILKAGGGYLPLDPAYPADRVAMMLEDSGAPVVVSRGAFALNVPAPASVTIVPADGAEVRSMDASPLDPASDADNLAYLIYTSGSTGRPKGVVVSHQNAINFLAGMDGVLGGGEPGTWLAVTSISFDISVLELFWTLARGFRVVLRRDEAWRAPATTAEVPREVQARPIDFSLFYFGGDLEATGAARYRLLMEGAKFADRNGFRAVWSPERHFHRFGGLYPNPSVLGAAIAAVTERVQIRAGSVVIPLHDPLRVAEEWAVVDNLSGGRVGVSFASGWHANDFVLAPEKYATRKAEFMGAIEQVRALWRGEKTVRTNGAGKEMEVGIFPPPVQANIPVWVTSAKDAETFRAAGATGAGLLTHLLGQTTEQLAEKIAVYRQAWREAGHEGEGHVVLMLHTYVGTDLEAVKEACRPALTEYLKTSFDLRSTLLAGLGKDADFNSLTADEIDALAQRAFGRFFGSAGLLGTPETCVDVVDRLKAAGVDEIGCLIDFGVPEDDALAGLQHLARVRDLSEARRRAAMATGDESVAEQMLAHGVTHFQCTPSLAQALAADPAAAGALAGLRHMLVGGEALPPELARTLADAVGGTVHNMYGPTEATVWATTQTVEAGAPVRIGRPMANARAYVADRHLRPCPVGVPGELLLGGDGVARGYLGRAALTADRFIPDPFGTRGGRLYRTGDLARWKTDGTLEYLGRTDFQVKVRGHRIELGEIESVLAAHPSVAQAVCAAPVMGADRALAAYVVPAAGAVVVADLKAWLRASLPEYMVPTAFVSMDALPLTPNGKVDRKALPSPEGVVAVAAYEAPATPTEEVLAALWATALRVERVGRTDDFFALGGHSLLVMRMASRLRETLRVDISLRAVFECPVLADLARRVDEARAAGLGTDAGPITPAPRDGHLPPSFSQQRMLFLNQLSPRDPAYNIASALRLEGALNVAILERAITEMVRRHESLRTRLLITDGTPAQVIDPAGPIHLPVLDLSALPAGEADTRATEIATDEAATGFDLSGPLFRPRLLRLAPDQHVLLLTLHHAIADGWSMGVFFRETSALYDAFAAGRPSPLAEPALQYADFSTWQRGAVMGGVMAAQLDYWKGKLAGAPAVLQVPTDRPRPPLQTSNGAREGHVLPAGVSRAVQALARREGATQFMVLLAGWKALLARYAGQDDVVVGSVVAGRGRPETEELMGFFATTLALRTDLSGDPTVRELVARVRETTLDAYAHQDLPFERLVDVLAPARDTSYSPVFQVSFGLQNAPAGELAFAGCRTSRVGAVRGASKYDLSLFAHPQGDGLAFTLEYNTDLFDRATARRVLRHLEALLASATGEPDARLSALSLAPAEELGLVLNAWAGADAVIPAHATFPALFEARVDEDSSRLAVLHEGGRVTYGELDARANRMAHHLRAMGVTADARVAVCLDRGPDMVAAIMGVMKAGAAYVPLDPAYPADRLAYMLNDSAAPVLITRADLLPGLPATGAAVVRVDADADAIAARPAHRPHAGVDADNLAYVIYTSGSTGRPKPVGVPHRGLVNVAAQQRVQLDITPGDRVLQFASLSFDAAAAEMTMALGSGGALVTAPRERLMPGAGLAALMREAGVTMVTLPPSAAALTPDHDLPLRVLTVAGEACPPELAARWGAGRRFVNLYGPTEATIWSTAREWDGGPLTIGRAIANTRAYVLDAALQPAPVGVPGELFVGGVGVARGYLGRAAMTAEKFIPDPFGAHPGARLYRTGDRVRWLADGTLEFLGRMDQQVKVRGFRIEPGEIEAVLALHPQVRDAVVVVREDRPGDHRLAGYVVTEPGAAPAAADLRRWAAERLPDYMVPAAFVTLERFPLTPNGKVDRRALPAPVAGRDAAGEAYLAPRTGVERELAADYAEVLGVDRVGLNDNFFDLGGNSLLLLKLHARLVERYPSLALMDLFEHPSVRGLARRLDHADTPPAAIEQSLERANLRRASVRPRERMIEP